VRWASLFVSLARGAVKGTWFQLRGDKDRALVSFLDPATALAFHLGRFRSNTVGTDVVRLRRPNALGRSSHFEGRPGP
jgi:hypothetical protein